MPAYVPQIISGDLDGEEAELLILESFKLDDKNYAIVAKAPDVDVALRTNGVPDLFTMVLAEDGLEGLDEEEEIQVLEAAEERGEKNIPTIYTFDPGDGLGKRAFEEWIVDPIETDRDEIAHLVVLFDTTNGDKCQVMVRSELAGGSFSFRPPDDADVSPYIELASQAKQLRDLRRRIG
jgi:hypothetical protein